MRTGAVEPCAITELPEAKEEPSPAIQKQNNAIDISTVNFWKVSSVFHSCLLLFFYLSIFSLLFFLLHSLLSFSVSFCVFVLSSLSSACICACARVFVVCVCVCVFPCVCGCWIFRHTEREREKKGSGSVQDNRAKHMPKCISSSDRSTP